MKIRWSRLSSLLLWEKTTSRFFDRIRLRTIQSKIIAFALMATLIPSVSMGWLSYRNNRRALDEKTFQELNALTSLASRELDLWIEEHHDQGKILSSSYEVTENLATLTDSGAARTTKNRALDRLRDYLESVQRRLVNYEEFVVLDAEGTLVASSADEPRDLHLRPGWLDRARDNQPLIGEPHWDEALRAQAMIVAESIRGEDDAFLGTFGARVTFDQVRGILATIVEDSPQELYVITREGQVLASSTDAGTIQRNLDPATARGLFARETVPAEFADFDGVRVIGAVQGVPKLDWGVVADKDRDQAYEEVVGLRNFTLALITAVLLGIGVTAYLFCLTIVRPLGRISMGATAVAGGDLEVKLPVYGRSEISHMTAAFNDMVDRLREFRDENVEINRQLLEHNEKLQELSIKDGLTGLYNRNHMPDMLARQLARAKRFGHKLAVLMVDIDHFKRFNDTHGHQAGDEALVDVAQVLEGCARQCDFVTRYGGEEFLIVLTATTRAGAKLFAERIREKVERMRSAGKAAVTISVGVASYPENGDEMESIIGHADAALYSCKREGRNRVELARSKRKRKTVGVSD